jgi:hypothetical protein
LEHGVPTLAQHKSNESRNRYHPEDVWNAVCQHSHYTGVMNPDSLPSGGSLERGVPTLALHGINGESAENYQLIDEDTPEEGDSTGNYPLINADSGR